MVSKFQKAVQPVAKDYKPMPQPMQVMTSSNTDEWYIPVEIVDMAREVFGGIIDTDPASAALPNTWIKAKQIYTIDDNGLDHPWYEAVWLTPPYGTEWVNGVLTNTASVWAKYLADSVESGDARQGIALLKNAQGYDWFESLWDRADAVCLMRERIKFHNVNGDQVGKAKQGSVFFYFGKSVVSFRRIFGEIGRVYTQYEGRLGA